MKLATLVTAAVIGGCGVAFAQTTPPPATTTTPPPATMPATPPTQVTPTTPPSGSTQAPMPGANSFTEAQARSWIEKSGYSDVGALVKSDDGIWRGPAKKNGMAVNVAVDFKGNVTTR